MSRGDVPLPQLEAQWRLAAAARDLGTFVIEGESFDCDLRAAELFGVRTAEHVARVLDVMHADDRASVTEGLRSVVDSTSEKAQWRGEARVGQRWLCLAIESLHVDTAAGAGPRIIGVVEDVTADHLRALVLARAERTRDLITGALGHDLRAPPSSIVMTASVLLHRNAAPGHELMLKRLMASGRRMATMIDDLLQFTRIGIGESLDLVTSHGDLATLTHACIERASAIHPDVRFHVTQQGALTGTWDEGLLAGTLMTMLHNAAMHGTAPQGEHPSADIDLDGTHVDEVVVRIQNRGVIPADVQRTLFELVREPGRDPALGGGLGIGLFNAKQVVVAHGGTIEVTSTDASGTTTFTVRLPRRQATTNAMAQATPSLPLPLPTTTMERSLDRAASSASTNSADVTAAIFGAAPLHERSGREYWNILDRYTRLLEMSLDRRTFKGAGSSVPDDLKRLAEELGALHASAREVVELHGRALRRLTMIANNAKSQAFVSEGRLLSLELMGHLLSYYRRRAGFPAQSGPGSGAAGTGTSSTGGGSAA